MTEQSEKEKHRSTAEALRLMTLNWERAETSLARVRGLLQRLLAESFSGEKVLRCRLCGSKLEHGHFGNCIVHELEAENVR